MDKPGPGMTGTSFLSGECNVSIYVIVYLYAADLLVVLMTAC